MHRSSSSRMYYPRGKTSPSWGLHKPLQSDYAKINQFLRNYLSYYAPKQEQEETQDMGGQNM